MNTYPPLQGRGFGFGGHMAVHVQQGNTPLQWATFALVLLLVVWFAAVLIALWARRDAFRHRRRMWMGRPGRGGRPDALEMLRMRYASGQMTREEFLQATGDLTSTAPATEHPPPAA